MTGLNASAVRANSGYRDMNSMTTDAQQAYLRRYCDERPLANYLQAVLSLYETLKFSN